MVEEEGAFKEAVEYWRNRGSLFMLSTLPQSEIKLYSLKSDGTISLPSTEDTKGSLEIKPLEKADDLKNGIAAYFTAKGKTVKPGPANTADIKKLAVTSNPYGSPLYYSDYYPEHHYYTDKVTVAGQVFDALFETSFVDLGEKNSYYTRRMLWFQNGFLIRCWFYGANTAEEVTQIDESLITQLQFKEIPLT